MSVTFVANPAISIEERLPNELLEHSIGFLPVRDLALSSRVNKTWNSRINATVKLLFSETQQGFQKLMGFILSHENLKRPQQLKVTELGELSEQPDQPELGGESPELQGQPNLGERQRERVQEFSAASIVPPNLELLNDSIISRKGLLISIIASKPNIRDAIRGNGFTGIRFFGDIAKTADRYAELFSHYEPNPNRQNQNVLSDKKKADRMRKELVKLCKDTDDRQLLMKVYETKNDEVYSVLNIPERIIKTIVCSNCPEKALKEALNMIFKLSESERENYCQIDRNWCFSQICNSLNTYRDMTEKEHFLSIAQGLPSHQLAWWKTAIEKRFEESEADSDAILGIWGRRDGAGSTGSSLSSASSANPDAGSEDEAAAPSSSGGTVVSRKRKREN